MRNVFENAKFATLYVTRDERKAVFLGAYKNAADESDIAYRCWIDGNDEPTDYNSEGRILNEAYAQFEDGSVEKYADDIIMTQQSFMLLSEAKKYGNC